MKTKHIRVCIGIFSVVILVFLIFLLVKNGPLNTVPTSKLRFENGNTVTLDYAISTEAGCFYSVSVPDTIFSDLNVNTKLAKSFFHNQFLEIQFYS